MPVVFVIMTNVNVSLHDVTVTSTTSTLTSSDVSNDVGIGLFTRVADAAAIPAAPVQQ